MFLLRLRAADWSLRSAAPAARERGARGSRTAGSGAWDYAATDGELMALGEPDVASRYPRHRVGGVDDGYRIRAPAGVSSLWNALGLVGRLRRPSRSSWSDSSRRSGSHDAPCSVRPRLERPMPPSDTQCPAFRSHHPGVCRGGRDLHRSSRPGLTSDHPASRPSPARCPIDFGAIDRSRRLRPLPEAEPSARGQEPT